MKRSKKVIRSILRQSQDYGVHLWVIFIFASITLAYSIKFYVNLPQNTHIAGETVEQEQPELLIDNTGIVEDGPAPTAAALGPVISLSFTVPGIGTSGGNLRPRHATRDVTIFLYNPDVNASDPRVKSAHIIKTKVIFDQDFQSPTYGLFHNPRIDLGPGVKDGLYQISFKTNQSFRTLIKDTPDAIQGRLFSLDKGNFEMTNENNPNFIPLQTVILGDISPIDGNNIVDIDDYRAFVNCFGGRSSDSLSCPYPNLADFNDDGITDSIDYNLLVLNYQKLAAMGIPVPTIFIEPTKFQVSRFSYLITPTQKPKQEQKKPATPTPTPTPTPAVQAASSGGAIGIFLFLLIIIGGAVGFVLFRKKFKGLPVPSIGNKATKQGEQAEQPAAEASSDQSGTVPPAQEPAAGTPSAEQQPGQVAQDYYVKIQGPDESKTGFWLDLTGDKGHELGHYKGAEVKEGFAQVKGTIKTENGKTFLEISELTPEA